MIAINLLIHVVRRELRLAFGAINCRNSLTLGPVYEDCECLMLNLDFKTAARRLTLIALLSALMYSTAFAQKVNRPKDGMKPGKPNQGISPVGFGNADGRAVVRSLAFLSSIIRPRNLFRDSVLYRESCDLQDVDPGVCLVCP